MGSVAPFVFWSMNICGIQKRAQQIGRPPGPHVESPADEQQQEMLQVFRTLTLNPKP